MTDAPERIWAVPYRNCTVYMGGNSPVMAQDGPFVHPRHGEGAEYVRADEIERLTAERDAALAGVAAAYEAADDDSHNNPKVVG